MRAFGLLSIVAASSLVLRVSSLTILPRQHVCANDGKTVAGTIFSRDLSETSSLHVRSGPPIPCIWCQLSSATYIVITAWTDPGVDPTNLRPFMQRRGLADATEFLQNTIRTSGDVFLPTGAYTYRDSWVMVQAANANNHQLTRGVVLAAFFALRSWMWAYNLYGTAAFKIYDGANQVGEGTVQLLSGPQG